jgi:hypothetical protein
MGTLTELARVITISKETIMYLHLLIHTLASAHVGVVTLMRAIKVQFDRVGPGGRFSAAAEKSPTRNHTRRLIKQFSERGHQESEQAVQAIPCRLSITISLFLAGVLPLSTMSPNRRSREMYRKTPAVTRKSFPCLASCWRRMHARLSSDGCLWSVQARCSKAI